MTLRCFRLETQGARIEAREMAVKDNVGLLDHKWMSLNMRWDLLRNKLIWFPVFAL